MVENGGSVFLGDFEIPLDQVVTAVIPEDKDVAVRIEKAERKTYTDKETGQEKAYYNLQLRLLDFPGEVIFHSFFLGARNLSKRKPTRSWKLFIEKLKVPYSEASNLVALQDRIFLARVRLDKKTDDYVLDDVIGPA